MKLSLLGLMMLTVFGGMLLGCQKNRQPDLDHAAILDSLVGKDLRNLSQKELSTLAKVLLKNPKAESLFPFPWYVWRMSDSGHIRYVLFEGEPIQVIPGNSSAAVHLLDSNGEGLGAWRFSAGWRLDLRDANFKYSPELGTDVLVLLSAPVINGRNVARQFFAFSNDRLRFIRLEDDKEQILQNEYRYPNQTLGVKTSAETVGQWIELLESNSKVDILSALVFIGGEHIGPSRFETNAAHEDVAQANLFLEICRNERVRLLVNQYSNADDVWVREAAALAARQLH